MDFLPLAVWAVGCLACISYEEIENKKMGKEDPTNERGQVFIWAAGSLTFAAIGLVSMFN